MSSGIDFLESGELRECVQKRRDAEHLYAVLAKDAAAHVEKLAHATSSCAHACACVLKNIEKDISALISGITPRRFGFVDREAAYFCACDFLVRMEDRKNELQDNVLSVIAIEKPLHDAKMMLLSAQDVKFSLLTRTAMLSVNMKSLP